MKNSNDDETPVPTATTRPVTRVLIGAVVVVGGLAAGCTAGSSADDASTTGPSAPEPASSTVTEQSVPSTEAGGVTSPAPTTEPGEDSETSVEHVERVLADFEVNAEIVRRYVLVEAGLDDERYVEIADELHALRPDLWFYLMDSDDEFEEMLAELPSLTSENDDSNWPYDYIDDHFVARVALELRPDDDGNVDRVWIVEGGPARRDLFVDLPLG